MDDNFVFESGERVQVGSHGQNNFVYATGDPVLDQGQSEFVFESGVGIGGILSDVVINGVSVGFYESNDRSLREIQNSDNLHYDDPVGNSDSPGYEAIGFTSATDTHYLWLGVFHSMKNGADDWGIGYYGWYENGPSNEGQFAIIFQDSAPLVAGDPSAPPGQDDPLSQGEDGGLENDTYGTVSDGDLRSDHAYGVQTGDGGLYQIDPTAVSLPYTITVEVTNADQHGDSSATDYSLPTTWRGKGPDGVTIQDISGAGDTITLELR